MAFIVEDGTGISDATSYVDIAFADSYFADRQDATWAQATISQKETCLIKATEYMDIRFGCVWAGTRTTDVQALDWPRQGVPNVEPDEIPTNLKRACCQYALRVAEGVDLLPDPQVNSAGLVSVATEQKVGPIAIKSGLAEKGFGSSVVIYRPYPMADGYLRGLLRRRNSGYTYR